MFDALMAGTRVCIVVVLCMNINIEVSKKIRELIAGIEKKGEESISKEVAEAAGALLVYAGWGGALAVTPEGEVFLYDYDTKLRSSPEENWRFFTLMKAARKFPELQDLAPPRPSAAVNCSSCGGRGVLFEKYDCGDCWASGWIVPRDK